VRESSDDSNAVKIGEDHSTRSSMPLKNSNGGLGVSCGVQSGQEEDSTAYHHAV